MKTELIQCQCGSVEPQHLRPQVRQEPDLSTALGDQKRYHHGLLLWIHLADHLPVLWSGLLVRIHTRDRH